VSRDADILMEIDLLKTLGTDRFSGEFLEDDAIALLTAELDGIVRERLRLKDSVRLIIDRFIVESSVDVRMICFEFHDSDVTDLKAELKKVFDG
jgi:hypothetical protein